MLRDNFLLSAMCDFNDDCLNIVFTGELLGSMMDKLHWMGVRRLYWNYHQPGLFEIMGDGSLSDGSTAIRETLQNLGNPLFTARRLAHERGLEFFAVIKPYETGISHTDPVGSTKVLRMPGLPGIGGVYEVDPWVMAHPEMRVRIRTADLPVGLDKVPVERIQVRQRDMSPVRIKRENIEIWTSADNNSYQKRDLSLTVSDSVETSPVDVYNREGELITRQGDSVRALDITGLSLLDPFIAVTTDFTDDNGSFRNTVLQMVHAFGPDDQPMDILGASYNSVWRPRRDLRHSDLQYDSGFGDMEICLDADNRVPEPTDGVVAMARGRNEFLSGALCEGYPEVREYWLSWVGECIAAGVDGVDVRLSNHSCWTNAPDSYGFNEPVLAEYQRRYGADPDRDSYDPELLGALRGEFFDVFLRAAKKRLSAAGKTFQVHVELESFRPDAMPGPRRSRPGKMTFNWRSWLRAGLPDEATIFGRLWFPDQALKDSMMREIITEATHAGVPTHYSHPVWKAHDPQAHADWVEAVYRGGPNGYTLYETSAMYKKELGPDGQLQFHPGLAEAIHDRVEKLGIVD